MKKIAKTISFLQFPCYAFLIFGVGGSNQVEAAIKATRAPGSKTR
jgi:hypothetical protein